MNAPAFAWKDKSLTVSKGLPYCDSLNFYQGFWVRKFYFDKRTRRLILTEAGSISLVDCGNVRCITDENQSLYDIIKSHISLRKLIFQISHRLFCLGSSALLHDTGSRIDAKLTGYIKGVAGKYSAG